MTKGQAKTMYQQVAQRHDGYSQAVRQQVSLDLLRRFDPFAVSPLTRDRATYYFLKRVLDVFVSTFALVILSPVMALIALLILLDSGWPVFFSQERIGAQRWTCAGFAYWQQTAFTCHKFRTMIKDADPHIHRAFVRAFIRDDQEGMAQVQRLCKDSGADPSTAFVQAFIPKNGEQAAGEKENESQIRKLVHDPRVTRIGSLLRKTSLDELPQFWDILKGNMSLVGPRPSISYEVDEYKPWHRQRLKCQPGLTGLWQVTARSSVDFDKMVRLDIQYIEHQSFWLDIRILLKTPFVVLSGKGAV